MLEKMFGSLVAMVQHEIFEKTRNFVIRNNFTAISLTQLQSKVEH